MAVRTHRLQQHPAVASVATSVRAILTELAMPCALLLAIALLGPLLDGDVEVVAWIWIGAGVCFATGWLLAASPSWLAGRVEVGADGVVVHRLRRLRFHAWSRVREVRRLAGAVVLESACGDSERVYPVDLPELERLLRDAREHHRRSPRAAPVPAFEPAGSALGPWLQRARHVLRDPTYRIAGVDVERLLELLSDARQTRVQRVAAAVALSTVGAPIQRRVREIVADTVEPEMSRTLTRAATGRVDIRTWRRIRPK